MNKALAVGLIRLAGMILPAKGVLVAGLKIWFAIPEKSPPRSAAVGTVFVLSTPLLDLMALKLKVQLVLSLLKRCGMFKGPPAVNPMRLYANAAFGTSTPSVRTGLKE